MVAYLKRKDLDDEQTLSSDRSRPVGPRVSGRHALTRDMLHGLSTEEFDREAKSPADAEALTPEVRERLRTKLVERLKTPIDPPTWGPDWIKRGQNSEPLTQKKPRGYFASLSPFGRNEDNDDEKEENEAIEALDEEDRNDAQIIARNIEKSRQVWHFRSLYILASLAAIQIALFAMAVDFSIIKGDVWTRALANEFMVVPPALQGTLLFKSLQVVFAALIVHFMLKITGIYGRNAMVTTGFFLVLVMIGGLGYLVAYNNLTGGTSTVQEHMQGSQPQQNSIDQLFASSDRHDGAIADNSAQPHLMAASMTAVPQSENLPFSLPKPSDKLLANADIWLWFAFASFIFFIVTIVAALYIQTFENNVRNYLISRDYLCRRKQFAQLHLLELADKNAN